jgi:thiamine biosynthesis protein ThiI
VSGADLEDIENIDVTEHDVPVFFPTIGMTDEEVSETIETISNGQ